MRPELKWTGEHMLRGSGCKMGVKVKSWDRRVWLEKVLNHARA